MFLEIMNKNESSINIINKLNTNGYIYIKNLLPKELIKLAKEDIIKYYQKNNYFNWYSKELCLNQHIINLTECGQLHDIFKKIYTNNIFSTFKEKWIRYYKKDMCTNEHIDFISNDFNNDNMRYTCWIPLDNYKIENGVLYLKEKSHIIYKENNDFSIKTIFENCNILTTNYEIGDVVIFDTRMSHGSNKNLTNEIRVSIECRWFKE